MTLKARIRELETEVAALRARPCEALPGIVYVPAAELHKAQAEIGRLLNRLVELEASKTP